MCRLAVTVALSLGRAMPVARHVAAKEDSERVETMKCEQTVQEERERRGVERTRQRGAGAWNPRSTARWQGEKTADTGSSDIRKQANSVTASASYSVALCPADPSPPRLHSFCFLQTFHHPSTHPIRRP